MVRVIRRESEKHEKVVSEEIIPTKTPSHKIVGTGTSIPKVKGGIVINKKKKF
jgi:hypothetical protein